jgi:hypothetical protein
VLGLKLALPKRRFDGVRRVPTLIRWQEGHAMEDLTTRGSSAPAHTLGWDVNRAAG